MTIVYDSEAYQGISAYRATIVHAQVPECPRPMGGPGLSILRQRIFEAPFEQVRISVAVYYKPQTGFQHVCQTVCTSGPIAIFLVEYDIAIKSGCHLPRLICSAVVSGSETCLPDCSTLAERSFTVKRPVSCQMLKLLEFCRLDCELLF